VRFRYFDPSQQQTIDGDVRGRTEVAELISMISTVSSGSGSPAVELSRHDGSTLVIAPSDERAVLLWTEPGGVTSHTVGDDQGESLVFDYFGAYTEMPARFSIPLSAAVGAAGDYLELGSPASGAVRFESD
jgi:hypothetical protein